MRENVSTKSISNKNSTQMRTKTTLLRPLSKRQLRHLESHPRRQSKHRLRPLFLDPCLRLRRRLHAPTKFEPAMSKNNVNNNPQLRTPADSTRTRRLSNRPTPRPRRCSNNNHDNITLHPFFTVPPPSNRRLRRTPRRPPSTENNYNGCRLSYFDHRIAQSSRAKAKRFFLGLRFTKRPSGLP